MSELYSKTIQRNHEIDTVKYTIKKLDKRLLYQQNKAMKLCHMVKTLTSENHHLTSLLHSVLGEKLIK